MTAKEYLIKGVNLSIQGRFAESIDFFNEAIKLDPSFAMAFYNRGIAKAVLYQYQAAIDDYSQAIKMNPIFLDAFVNRGILRVRLNQYQAAIDDCTIAIKLDSNCTDAFFYRGITKASLNQHQAAIDDYSNAIEIDPNLSYAFVNRGVAKAKLNQHQAAIADYNQAIELDSNFSSAFLNRGVSKSKLNQHQAAIVDISQAIEMNPHYTKAFLERGLVKSKLNQHQAAIADYSQAIEIDSSFADAFLNRGVSKAALNQHQAAIADYSQAIEIDPNFTGAFTNRGVSKAKLNQHQAAIADYSQAIEIDPNFTSAFINRGTSKAKLNQYQAAIDDCNIAISINSKINTCYLIRGQIYLRANFPSKAKIDFLKSMFLKIKWHNDFIPFFSKHSNNPFLAMRFIQNQIELSFYRDKSDLIKISFEQSSALYSFIIHQGLKRNITYSPKKWNKWLGIINYFMGDPIVSQNLLDNLAKNGTNDLMIYYYLILSLKEFEQTGKSQEIDEILEVAIPIAESYSELNTNSYTKQQRQNLYYAGQLLIVDEEDEDALECFLKIRNEFLPALYMCIYLNNRLGKSEENQIFITSLIQKEELLDNQSGFLHGLSSQQLDLEIEDLYEPFRHCINYKEIHYAIEVTITEITKIGISTSIDIKKPNFQKDFWDLFKVSLQDVESARLRSNLSPVVEKWEEILSSYQEEISKADLDIHKQQLKKDLDTRNPYKEIKKASDKEAELGLHIQKFKLKSNQLIDLINYFYLKSQLTAYQKLLLHFYTLDQELKRDTSSKAHLSGLKDGVKKAIGEGLSVITGIIVGTIVPGLTTIGQIIAISLATFGASYTKGALGELFLDFHKSLNNTPVLSYDDFKKEFEIYIAVQIEEIGESRFYRRYPIDELKTKKKIHL